MELNDFHLRLCSSEKWQDCILRITVLAQLLLFIGIRTEYVVYLIDWIALLQTSFGLIIFGVWNLILSIRRSVSVYGLNRILLSCVFIIVSSCAFVVVLAQTEVWTWNKLELTFIKKLEENVVKINETRAEFRFRDIRSYEPYTLEKHSRYNGEDIRLICEKTLYFQNEVRWHQQQVIWKHNQERVESSDRHHIETIFETVPTTNEDIRIWPELLNIDVHAYYIVSTLDIYMIDGGDYGKYSCHIANKALGFDPKEKEPIRTPDPEERNECPQEEPQETKCRCPWDLYLERLRVEQELVSYDWTAEFIVSQIVPKKRVVFVPLGSIISVSASYRHLDEAPVEFNHQINGKSFVDACDNYKQICSILIYSYWFVWHNGGHYTKLPAFDKRIEMVEGVGGTSWQCVCPYTYGTHRFVFQREFFNRTIGMYQKIEIPYPDITTLKPQEPNILQPYFNASQEPLPLPKLSCWGNFKELMCIYLERILQDQASEFFYNEKRFIFICVVNVVCSAMLLVFTIALFINPVTYYILNRQINPLNTARVLAGLETDTTNLDYDLFISCDEEQTGIAAQIATYLQSQGLRVCLSDVDILGNELTTQGISRLVAKSRKYLVIVSSEYVQNRLLNDFELQLILQRFHDGIDSRNIALLELAPHLISSVFRQFVIFRCLESIDSFNISLLKEWYGPSVFGTDTHFSSMNWWGKLRYIAIEHRFFRRMLIFVSIYIALSVINILSNVIVMSY